MSPNDAFVRLQKDGAFVEHDGNIERRWYWHNMPHGFMIMASQNVHSNDAPTYFKHFFVRDDFYVRNRY